MFLISVGGEVDGAPGLAIEGRSRGPGEEVSGTERACSCLQLAACVPVGPSERETRQPTVRAARRVHEIGQVARRVICQNLSGEGEKDLREIYGAGATRREQKQCRQPRVLRLARGTVYMERAGGTRCPPASLVVLALPGAHCQQRQPRGNGPLIGEFPGALEFPLCSSRTAFFALPRGCCGSTRWAKPLTSHTYAHTGTHTHGHTHTHTHTRLNDWCTGHLGRARLAEANFQIPCRRITDWTFLDTKPPRPRN